MWSQSDVETWIIEEFFGMFRLYYSPIQPALPCTFDLTTDHECIASFTELHAIVYHRNPAYGVFTEITNETARDESRFVLCDLHCRRDAEGQLKATVSLPSFPSGQQGNEHSAQELTLSLIMGPLEPMRVLTVQAHFHISLVIISDAETAARTQVRCDAKDFTITEENPLVVLPGKKHTKTYMNFDKPPPTKMDESKMSTTDLSRIFDADAEVELPIKK